MTDSKITLQEWLDEWLEAYVKPILAAKTYRCYYDTVRRIAREKPDFYSMAMDDVLEIQIQKFINCMAFRYAKSTLNDIRVALNQAYIAAVHNGVCSRNPISHISIPKNASQRIVRPLTQDEQVELEKAARDDPLGHIVLFFLYTGLRSNELCSLEWNDYDRLRDYVFVRKSKTKAGRRTIPLIPEAKAIIERLPNNGDFLFSSTRKGPVTESVLKKLYLRMRKKTGIKTITNHVYRHSFATRLLEQGADYKALSKLLGHTDVAFTLRQYTDAEDMFLRQQINLLCKHPSEEVNCKRIS